MTEQEARDAAIGTPFKQSWDEWIDGDEGQRCASFTTLKKATFPDILENRLWAAYCAGWNAAVAKEMKEAEKV